MFNASQCKEKVHGKLGRKRTYNCQECRVKFQVETLKPLPDIERVCPSCKDRTHVYYFVDKNTGEEVGIRASSAELATLRAWDKNRNLTFNLNQGEQR